MKEYEGFVCDVESGYNFSIVFDVEKLPEDKGNQSHYALNASDLTLRFFEITSNSGHVFHVIHRIMKPLFIKFLINNR